jgi:hypothetical protein
MSVGIGLFALVGDRMACWRRRALQCWSGVVAWSSCGSGWARSSASRALAMSAAALYLLTTPIVGRVLR